MSFFKNTKKLILFGFIAVLLVAIPFTIYILQKQQQTQSKATPATTLSFANQSPNPATVGQPVSLDVMMNPGSNQVIGATIKINFDTSLLGSATLTPNSSAFSQTVQGPTYNPPGTASITMTVGVDITKVISQTTKVATITFTPAANGTANVSFDSANTIITSASDSETNVLSQASPTTIVIGTVTPTPTPTVTTTTVPTATAAPAAPTSTPAPTTVAPTTAPPTPTATATATDSAFPTAIPYVSPTPTIPIPTPTTVPLPKPGPSDTFIKLGALGAALSILGAITFIVL